MRYLSYQITFQEVPDEISLSFLITGCSLKCPGCHSPDSWNPNHGTELTTTKLLELLTNCQNIITCVLFMGGEWHSAELIGFLKICKNMNLKTCLYTGLSDVSAEIKRELTFLKTGSWNNQLGGLSSPSTNQILTELDTGRILNFYYNAQGGQNG